VPHYSSIRYNGKDGLGLHARDYAAATASGRLPLICIHGLTRNAADFDEFAPMVAALGRRVLALDVRGRGVFVGTSMGGLITMTLAGRHLERIAAAVLNDIGPVISQKGLARIAGYAGKRATPASWQEAAATMRTLNQCAFPDNDDAEWDKWARRAFAADVSGRLAPRYDASIAKAMQTGKLRTTSLGLRRDFRRLAQAVPTLLVRGELSDLLEARQSGWMRRQAPGMGYAEVPGVGHAPMLTEPAAFDAIARFLAAVP
jgi:pimeloyl-ACP methyl ester carboxylesterase